MIQPAHYHRSNPVLWIGVSLVLTATLWMAISISQRTAGRTGLLSQLASSASVSSSLALDKDRPLVTYAFYETENARANLEFFLRHGLHDDADFLFILNGETSVEAEIPTNRTNVRVVRRENVCFDLGGHGEVLARDDLWRRYRRFIIMNASIRGPFLPTWSHDRWTDLFLNRVNETTKLVGLTFNCRPAPHVQSMLWATDADGMAVLLDRDLAVGSGGQPRGLAFCYQSMWQAMEGEVSTTDLIRSQGYGVDVLETAFHSSRRFITECPETEANDPNFDGWYYGISIHPYETVFIKANRDINPHLLELYTAWHDAMAGGEQTMAGFIPSQIKPPSEDDGGESKAGGGDGEGREAEDGEAAARARRSRRR